MSDNPMADEADELARLLAPQRPPRDDRREELFRATAQVLRRRRWARRSCVVVALAACYAAGLSTMTLVRPAAVPHPGAPLPAEPPRSLPNEPTPGVLASAEDDDVPAVVLEKLASLGPAGDRARYLQQAGDKYLEANELESAGRCYRQALDAGSWEQWSVAPNDSWLLIAVKQAKLKEVLHAKSDG